MTFTQLNLDPNQSGGHMTDFNAAADQDMVEFNTENLTRVKPTTRGRTAA